MSQTPTPSSPIHTPVTELSPEEGMVDPLELTPQLTIQIPQVEVEDDNEDEEDEEDDNEDEEEDEEIDPIPLEDNNENLLSDSDIEIVENILEEEKEEKKEEYKNKHESYDCGVCYKTLTMDDNVVTKCSHHYCKDCFYRWIQTNASCPMCRTPITSNAHLTEEQLQMALSEEYSYYVHILEKSNRTLKANLKIQNEFIRLKHKTDLLLMRQISLREQMDLTIAATNGIIACREKMLNNNKELKEKFSNQYYKIHDGKFYNEFHRSYKNEKERLIQIDFDPEIVKQNMKIKSKRKIVIKKRPAPSDVVFKFCAGEKKMKKNSEEKVSNKAEQEEESAAAAAPASATETVNAIADALSNAVEV